MAYGCKGRGRYGVKEYQRHYLNMDLLSFYEIILFKHFNIIYTLDTQNDKLSKTVGSFSLYVQIYSLLLNMFTYIETYIKKINNFFKNCYVCYYFA